MKLGLLLQQKGLLQWKGRKGEKAAFITFVCCTEGF